MKEKKKGHSKANLNFFEETILIFFFNFLKIVDFILW